MAVKEQIDIEALLHRAYAQYRVHRVTPGNVLGLYAPMQGPSSYASLMSILELGTRVDTSGIGARLAGLQTMASATPDDMLIVHDHVLALSQWLIEGADTAEPSVWRRDEIAANGWRIEDAATGLWLVRPDTSGEAADVWARLTEPYLAAVVIEHASAGSRPDWQTGREKRRGRATKVELAEERQARAFYACWRAALAVLAAELASVLAKHEPTGPAASAEPWNARVLADVV
ncbi:hypothetical protein [Bosea sp. BK604]|uniref:hypothetical protein n=1 Tax=Bosea sp. BK604 TaxID=2512180 RepID=UPI00104B21D5|nr:hypothetical protein [Bosea sp. BK604]TCR69704.1 hypothetical protein EV560_101101 [Bosea sp. BK604]